MGEPARRASSRGSVGRRRLRRTRVVLRDIGRRGARAKSPRPPRGARRAKAGRAPWRAARPSTRNDGEGTSAEGVAGGWCLGFPARRWAVTPVTASPSSMARVRVGTAVAGEQRRVHAEPAEGARLERRKSGGASSNPAHQEVRPRVAHAPEQRVVVGAGAPEEPPAEQPRPPRCRGVGAAAGDQRELVPVGVEEERGQRQAEERDAHVASSPAPGLPVRKLGRSSAPWLWG